MIEQLTNAGDLLAADKSHRSGADWLSENVIAPAMNAGPLGVYNTAADLVHLPTVHLETEKAAPYSVEWYTQGLASGVGAAVPFALMGVATGSAMRFVDRSLGETALGVSLSPYLNSERIATVAGASLYGALQTPDAEHSRFGNALGMAAGLALFGAGNDLIKDSPILQKALAYPVIGFVGGGAMTEASQFASNLKLANSDQALQGAVQGMTMNSVMGLGADYLAKKSEQEHSPAAGKSTDALGAGRNNSVERFNAADVKVQQFSPELNSALEKVARIDREYSAYVNDTKPVYPHPDEFANLSPDDIVKLGFHHEDAENLGILQAFKGDKKPRPLPDAKVVADEVGKALKDMPLAAEKGDLKIGEWNMEFLTADKARYFKDTYSQIVPRHHLLFVEEANDAGLKEIAKDNGYNYAVSRENSRGQAVGFLVNPRLEILKTTSIDAVANVENIPDLRPALRIDLRDTSTGDEFSAVVVHLKSMLGGPEATAPIRTQQAQILANELGPDFKGIIAGDWNTFLDKTRELNPLQSAGYQISNPTDNSSTQSMGGRLDGFVYRNLNGQLSKETVNPFFKNPLITRGLSDHALLSTTLKMGN
jgi:hypothetical protein